jgi:hypothetical protein
MSIPNRVMEMMAAIILFGKPAWHYGGNPSPFGFMMGGIVHAGMVFAILLAR